jgi:hypothetical protein
MVRRAAHTSLCEDSDDLAHQTEVRTVSAGRYRLTDRIAAGGMGEVWRREDDLLTRSVAVTGVLPGAEGPGTAPPGGHGGPQGLRRSRRRRRLVAAGWTAALCAAAAAAGFYLTGNISGQGSGYVDANTAQHLSSPAATQTHQVRQSPRHTPTPTPSLAVNPPAPGPSGNPKPAKSSKPSSTPTSPGPTPSSPLPHAGQVMPGRLAARRWPRGDRSM